jgi:hypothetical protein
LAHLGDKGDGCKENAMVAVSEEILAFGGEMIGEFGDAFDYTKSAKRCLATT